MKFALDHVEILTERLLKILLSSRPAVLISGSALTIPELSFEFTIGHWYSYFSSAFLVVSSDQKCARFGLREWPPFGPVASRLNFGSALLQPSSVLLSFWSLLWLSRPPACSVPNCGPTPFNYPCVGSYETNGGKCCRHRVRESASLD
jgi:hypothetical protein